ncbi:MAG: nucleoside 2-deoxyribosyltransferase [Deltaproteobacteria bacterium]|nr:nucleoside 2-deoxyribosyltransferase [Deltaproteobacteria bacterium]
MVRRRTVFTLIPKDEDFKEIYNDSIKETCNELGAKCERLDEALFDDASKCNTLSKISGADLVIAHMSGSNPDVAFKAGYAKGLNKKMILLSSKEGDIPQDLSDSKHIVYSGDVESLKKELEKEISESLEEKDKRDDEILWNKLMM